MNRSKLEQKLFEYLTKQVLNKRLVRENPFSAFLIVDSIVNSKKGMKYLEWSTHAMTGIVLGYVVTGDWKLSLISGLAALIPDLDEPRSKFGKPLFFISIPLNQVFGHRTFTHSLLFVGIIGLITAFFNLSIALASILGVLTHIIGDMLTGKVKLLYPNKKGYGLGISRFSYVLTDRITRLISLILIGLICYYEIHLHL